ncbi:zinc finger protein 862-like [Ruditapes philippinarum]|uniref:zinc finger protein 862-like n=1 Tax=Ruditapes philippinarum TaxID=129788 RepID=UPI00295A912E|nr:zinc finger protein 862-like [Ruditapes philippinarum]
MKRISDFFLPNSNAKKSKSPDKEPTKNVDSVPCTSQSDPGPSESSQRREFQGKWLKDDRFKNWLIFDDDKKCCPDILTLHSGDNATYVSERAAEEFQDALNHVIENGMKQKLASARAISLMCDESDDVSVQKKLVIFARFIPECTDFQPETHFIENDTIDKGDAETVYQSLKSVVSAKGMDVSNVMFFGSDGAAVMTGKKSGVSARLSSDQPLIVNIHCVAHKLALCTSQAAESIPYLKKYKEILTNIFYHFKHSSLRTANLSKIESVLNDKQLKIKEIHSVRWFAFYSALEAIFHTWGSLVTYFEQEKQAEKGGTAKGIHSQLTQFEFVGVTYLFMDIMPILTKLSLSFQKQDIDISLVQPLIQSTISQLEHLKQNNGHYMQLFNTALTENGLDLRDHSISASKNKQKHLSNIRSDFIQKIIAQLNVRFPQEDTSVISALAVLGLRGISFVQNIPDHGKNEINKLCDFYGSSNNDTDSEPYIDSNQLRIEWEILKPLVIQQRYPTDNIYNLWKLIFMYHKEMFPNLLKLAELALIAPLQTADCERGFSTQNDIKSSDRNRLSSNRLNKLMRISLHKVDIADFDFDKAVDAWLSVKNRRAFSSTST